MAELEDAPWAVKKDEKSPKGEDLPDAPWHTPGVAEDVGKTVGPSLLRGSLMAITTPRAISDITGQATNYLANKFGSPAVAEAANKFHNMDTGVGKVLPTYEELKSKTERDLTGPLYEAKTGVGKGVQTGTEVLPSMLAGGEGAITPLVRSVGAGTLSGLLGSGAAKLHEMFPNAISEKAEPVARGAGALIGGSVAPRVVTPLPMTNEQLATTNALKAVNPELNQASSAGQLTGSPRIAALEARSPRMADLPQAQAEAYTKGVMRQAGSNGMFDTAGLAQGAQTGEDLRLLREAHNMTPAEFAALNSKARTDYTNLQPTVGVENAKPFFNVKEDIRVGPNRGTPNFPNSGPLLPTDMPGARFHSMMGDVRAAGEAAPNATTKNAIFGLRNDMNKAFLNSVPNDVADKLEALRNQYGTYHALNSIPRKVGENTVTPQQVFAKARAGSPLETHAEQASSIMKPLPTPSNEPSEMTKAITTGIGGLLGAALGAKSGYIPAVSEGLVGMIAGEKLPSYMNVAKNAAGRAIATPTAQSYLKNQTLRPQGTFTDAPNREALVKLLMQQGPRQLPPITVEGGNNR